MLTYSKGFTKQRTKLKPSTYWRIIQIFLLQRSTCCIRSSQVSSYGIRITSYSCDTRRGDSLETGLSSERSSKFTFPVPQWIWHMWTWLILNRFTRAKPRHLSTSLHSPENRYFSFVMEHFSEKEIFVLWNYSFIIYLYYIHKWSHFLILVSSLFHLFSFECGCLF